ncbi:hypothetical protein HZH68_001541 [Vespula germanica]|uniref:Uncharacterized protein n=1 Tax=Vespula germanica TaxID=30212 RepID=A0A834NVQ6_VESGE|nr:hypothetical protein HZH68_001541 [Vespula germanica]
MMMTTTTTMMMMMMTTNDDDDDDEKENKDLRLFLLDLDLKLLRTVLTCSASEHLEIEKLEKVAPMATAQQNSNSNSNGISISISGSSNGRLASGNPEGGLVRVERYEAKRFDKLPRGEKGR